MKKQLEEKELVKIYKQIGFDRIPDAIKRVGWEQAAEEFAGQFMSTIIHKHALPTANYQPSISMAQWYLESIETGFSFPEFVTEY